MSDLIDRQAAIEEAKTLFEPSNYGYMIGVGYNHAVADCIAILNNLPSAHRTGRWEYVKKRLVRGGYVDASECSVCHKRIMPHLKPNFCPNCGARMEETDERT